jgi:hypothetical protein
MANSRRRDVLKAAGTVAFVGGIAGCAGQDDTGTTSGQEGNETETEPDAEQSQADEMGALRAVHASPDAPNVDIYVDGEAAIEDLGFGEVSAYEMLEPGTHQIQVTAAGDPDTVVFDEEIEVESGMTNTAIAFGEAAGGPETAFAVEILEDDITDPGDGMSRVRLFHASPDAGDVDIVVTQAPEGSQEDTPQQGDVLFEGVGFGDSETAEIPAGDYTLGVVPADGDQAEPVAEFDLAAEPQAVYSAFALGYVDPESVDSEEAFEVVTVEDAVAGERSETGAEGGAEGDSAGDPGTGNETENGSGNETENTTTDSEQMALGR